MESPLKTDISYCFTNFLYGEVAALKKSLSGLNNLYCCLHRHKVHAPWTDDTQEQQIILTIHLRPAKLPTSLSSG